MNKVIILIPIIIVGFLFISASESSESEKMRDIKVPGISVKTQAIQIKGALKPDLNFGKFPLYFIANKGQVDKKAKYYAKASQYTLWLTREGLVFDSVRKVKVEAATTHSAPSGHPSQEGSNQLPHLPSSPKIDRDVSRLIFLNANKNPGIVPVEEAKLRVNYFIGNDSSKWHSDVPTSKAVLYKNLYKNIDLKVYGIEKQIEYDWIVKPGGNPGDIRFEYKNIKGTRLDEQGNLLIGTDFGKLIHKKPVSYQEVVVGAGSQTCPEKRKNVKVTFKRINSNTYGFEVGDYDKNRELIIDPVILVDSTYFGGSGGEAGNGIAVDGSGFVYIVGSTSSTDFPTWHSYQTDQPKTDVFVTKLDENLDGYHYYSTYIGGSDDESGTSIAVDNNGFVYVMGDTLSKNFPIKNQFQQYGGVFLVKLDTTRSGPDSLLYSTRLGENYKYFVHAITADNSGCVYLTGETNSGNIPLLNQYQYHQGSYDAFVTKLDTTKKGASCLRYSTYLGGMANDVGYGIAVDSSGYVYVAGYTGSNNFPIRKQYQTNQPNRDAFVTKLDPSQSGDSSLIYSTYFGGMEFDEAHAIAVDRNGNAYVAGCICHLSGLDPKCCDEIFVIKIDTNRSGASGLIHSIYLEHPEPVEDYTFYFDMGIAVDSSENVYTACYRYYPNFYGGFLAKLDADFNLIYSTYFNDDYYGMALDPCGYVYMVGGGHDVYIAKLISTPIVPPGLTTTAVSSVTRTSASCGGNITDDGSVPVTARGVCWGTSRGPTTSGSHTTDGIGTGMFTSSLTGLTPGTTYYVRAYATNLAGTAYGNEVKFTTTLPEPPHIQLNRTRLNFGAVSGGTRTGSQTFLIINMGGSSLKWTISTTGTWIKASPLSGTGGMLVTASVETAGLAPGSYRGMITITDPNADNSPVEVEAYLEVKTGTQDLPPFGTFETPRSGAVVYSSIPVTGWVLDDVEVKHVKIYRNPVPGQEKGLIYIGDGVFVEGARPDVEQAYPQYPFNYKAGWGYMMLTNFLPNQGNGTFVITAVAADSSGKQVTLGSKTIIVDNASAVKPFGAIDTPTQGGNAAGSQFINWGWVLTPQPNLIPTDGSTIRVYVDGVNLGSPTYNIFRADIAGLFPTYANSNGAVGYFFLDTTPYDNGVHTIQWTAQDNAGNSDGIGSRYFTIQNTGNNSRVRSKEQGGLPPCFQDKQDKEQALLFHGPGSLPLVGSSPVPIESIHIKKGFDENKKPQAIYPGKNGIIHIEIKELERIEIHFSGEIFNFSPLPIGSFLDAREGKFYWQPGVGFIGEYRFAFIERGPTGESKMRTITVTIHSKY
jgi:hypothetical protein